MDGWRFHERLKKQKNQVCPPGFRRAATVLTPFCNTLEEFSAQWKSYENNPHYNIAKWTPNPLWHLFGSGCEHTYELQELLLEFDSDGDFNPDDQETRERYDKLMEIFEEALADLDATGFFGTGAKRNEVVLMITVASEEAETRDEAIRRCLNPDGREIELEILKRLNPYEAIATILDLLE